MPAKCPVCETDTPDDAMECPTCGKVLATDADLVEDVPLIDGLEQTLQEKITADDAQLIPGLEQTQIADKLLKVADEHVPDVEYTQLEEDPSAPVNWMGGAPIDLGREPDDGVRTPAPQDTGTCPWCSAPATGAVCDNCGRRRSRYSTPPAQPEVRLEPGDGILCPACFARVPPGARCNECGVPFAVVEL
jgi:hypothetical protein